MKQKVAGSLFSGGGVGDVGLEWGAGIPVIAAGEIVPSRAALIRKNFPDNRVFEGDIHDFKDDYVQYIQKKLKGVNLWLLTLSPPCQGMSSNGAGRISAEIKAGKRPHEDQRNRLILPGIEILEKLKVCCFFLSNALPAITPNIAPIGPPNAKPAAPPNNLPQILIATFL